MGDLTGEQLSINVHQKGNTPSYIQSVNPTDSLPIAPAHQGVPLGLGLHVFHQVDLDLASTPPQYEGRLIIPAPPPPPPPPKPC